MAPSVWKNYKANEIWTPSSISFGGDIITSYHTIPAELIPDINKYNFLILDSSYMTRVFICTKDMEILSTTNPLYYPSNVICRYIDSTESAPMLGLIGSIYTSNNTLKEWSHCYNGMESTSSGGENSTYITNQDIYYYNKGKTETVVLTANYTEPTTKNTLYLTDTILQKKVLNVGVNYCTSVKYSDLATAIGLTADKIKAGETILGITGTYVGAMSQADYNDAVDTANDILGNS